MESKPVAFFDRDGTMIEDQEYQFDPGSLVWMPGAIEALQQLKAAGWMCVVVTNQSAVARGFCTEVDVQEFHRVMSAYALREGATIDCFEYCPFLSDAPVPQYRSDDHPDRKPNPGMILRHLPKDPIAFSRSFLIGDKPSDVEAATAAGIPGYFYKPGNSLFDTVRTAMSKAPESLKHGR